MFSGSKKFQAKQTILRSALSCSLLFSSFTMAAPRTADKLDNGNHSVADTRVAGTMNMGRYATKYAAPVNASMIRKVRVNKAQGGMMAVIELDGLAKFNHFTLPSPYRLVVDIQNVSNTTPPVIEVGDFGIKRIRVGKLEDMVRVVFDAEKQQPYEITSEGTQIRVAFGNVNALQAINTEAKTNGVSSSVVKPVVTTTPTNATAATTKETVLTTPSATKYTVAPNPTAPKVNEAPKAIAVNVPTTTSVNKPVAVKAPVATTPVVVSAQEQAVILPTASTLKAKAFRSRKRANSFTKAQLLASNIKFDTAINDVPPPPKTTPAPVVAPNAGSKLARKAALPVETPKPINAKNDKVAGSVVTATPQPIVPPANANVRPREIAGPLPSQAKIFRATDYLRTDFQGEPINLDLRSSANKTVDIRDFLRFISDTYKVNFVMDQSVKDVPITVTLQGIPWNRAMDAILKANRLGVKVDGDILRILTADAITQEDRLLQEQLEARQKAGTLITKTIRLNYALAQSAGGAGATSSAGGAAVGASGSSGSSAGGAGGAAGGSTGGSGLAGIIATSLSPRGSIQSDPRTNMLIIKDLPENVAAIEEIIKILDVPEPQVEIEARIVIANRNFARDLGVQLGAVAVNPSRGGTGYFGTLPQGTSTTGGGGAATGSSPTGTTPFGVPTGVAGTQAPSGRLGVSGANTVLSLTTGIFGTAQISAILSMNESKGNLKTISAPRITAQNNQKASIVNGVQIPVQTESNNTLAVSFVTAALSLEITPQITDNGYVNLRVVASNDSVNTSYSTSAAPGINKQQAQTTVLVPDGGTTIIGGINVDVESNSQQRTPGISSIPGLGELFKRRTVSRQTDEILFFITPRIYRPFGTPTVANPSLGQK